MPVNAQNYALANAKPPTNSPPADSSARMRVMWDFIDADATNIADDVNVGAMPLPKGARILGGQINVDGNGTGSLSLKVGSVIIALDAAITAAGSTFLNSTATLVDFVLTEDTQVIASYGSANTAGLASFEVRYTID